MPINIHGKQYKTVAERVTEFRELYKQEFSIITEIISASEVVQIKASIIDKDGRIHANGFAEEIRGSTNINKTSALENCETSAIGRALAAFGLGGTEYATANEVTDAILQQEVMKAVEAAEAKSRAYMMAVRDHWESIIHIKKELEDIEGLSSAAEAWFELPDDIKRALWIAPKNGGIFTTAERDVIKSAEFRTAYHGESAA